MTTVADLVAGSAVRVSPLDSNPFREPDALQEAQVLEVRFDVMLASVAVLFELRTALDFEGFDVGVLIAQEVTELRWDGERRDTRRTAWVVGGSAVEMDASSMSIRLGLFPDGALHIRAGAACFYAGRVPGLWNIPNYVDDSDETIRANLPNWSSHLEHVSSADSRDEAAL